LIIYVPGANNTYGNNVTRRVSSQTEGADKSYVDYNFLLPDSRVLAFFVYSRGITQPGPDVFYRLQIWRPIDISRLRFQLVWQQKVQITNTTEGLYTVSNTVYANKIRYLNLLLTTIVKVHLMLYGILSLIWVHIGLNAVFALEMRLRIYVTSSELHDVI